METEEKDELRKKVRELVDLIQSMSSWNKFNAKTIIYWCTATYGHAQVTKFPLLNVVGIYESGKSTTLNMIQALAKASLEDDRKEMMLVGKMTAPVVKQKLSRGGTHVIDESDFFDEHFIPHVFDKTIGAFSKNENMGGNQWKVIEIKVNGALALHLRKPLKDPANESRCITLRTRKIKDYDESKINPDMDKIEPYRETLESISNRLCTWKEIPTNASSRAREKWRILIHVAEKLGDTEYIKEAENQLELDGGRLDDSEEIEIAIFRMILHKAGAKGMVDGRYASFKEKVKSKEIRKEYAEDIDAHVTTTQVNTTAQAIGFRKSNYAGDVWIWLPHNPGYRLQFMRDIANSINYEDEALG